MLDYLLPAYAYDYVPYSSIFTIELRRDNECMRNVVFNPQENCMAIRIKYNGQFVNLGSKTVDEASALLDRPDFEMNSQQLAVLEDKYDMPYAKFKAIMEAVLVKGSEVMDECAKKFSPIPDP
jgi:hypothetical protein